MRGVYGGYEIYFHEGIYAYKLITSNGVRGMNIPVEVTRRADNTIEVYCKGRKIEITEVYRSTQNWEKVA